MNQVYKYKGFTGVKIGDQFWMNNNLVSNNLNAKQWYVTDKEHPEFGDYFKWENVYYNKKYIIPDGWKWPSMEDYDKLDNFFKGDKDHLLFTFNATYSSFYMKKDHDDYYNKSVKKQLNGMNISMYWCSDYTGTGQAYVFFIIGLGSRGYNNDILNITNQDSYYMSLDAGTCFAPIRCFQDWNIVQKWLNENQNVDNIELDDLDEINESKRFFKLSERFL
jgi:uncharacterized protein (TIGR02145 family)